MASLGILVADLAEALGLPEATVAAYAKTLREAGLIRTGGRGPSAAAMTSDDAAHLLCAILCSPTIAEAPARTRKAMRLPFTGSFETSTNGMWERRKSQSVTFLRSPLDAVPPFVFGDGMKTLIASAVLVSEQHEGELSDVSKELSEFWSAEAAQVTFGSPAPVAVISTYVRQDTIRRHIFGYRPFDANASNGHFDLLDWEASLSGGELTQARRIATKTLRALAASIRKPVKPL